MNGYALMSLSRRGLLLETAPATVDTALCSVTGQLNGGEVRDPIRWEGEINHLAERLTGYISILARQSSWERAVTYARKGADVGGRAKREDLVARFRIEEAELYICTGKYEKAHTLLRGTLRDARDAQAQLWALQDCAVVAALQRQYLKAASLFRSAKRTLEFSDPVDQLIHTNNAGRLMLEQGKVQGAYSAFRIALSSARRLSCSELEAIAHINLAEYWLSQSDFIQSRQHLDEAIAYFVQTQNHYRQVYALQLLGDLLYESGESPEARAYYERAQALAAQVDAKGSIDILKDRLANV